MEPLETIENVIKENPIILFMKGSPDFPQCGFSMKVSEALKECGVDFAHVDVIAQPDVRTNLPQYSKWPTFPQLFVNGELIGGCDITLDLHQKGSLKEKLQEAVK